MIQQITLLLSTPRLTSVFPYDKWNKYWRLTIAALLCTMGLSAAPGAGFNTAGEHILPGDTSITATICANETYVFGGESLHLSGQYAAVFEASDGSDSTVVLDLTVLPVPVSHQSATICAGETYSFNGLTLSESGVYEAVQEAENGCDSISTLTLVVLDSPVTTPSAAICAGSSYVFQGETLTESGVYSKELVAENGCDSLVTLNLSVVEFFEFALNASVCAGETYVFGDETLDEAGTYVHALSAAGGCDSTITLTLTVLPQASSAVEASVCAGEIYAFHGQELEEAGEYTAVLEAENGCDSTVTLTLTVLPHASSAVEASVCAGEIYKFHGQELEEAGEYTAVLEAENGCDSTVTLTLTVLPQASSAVEASVCAGEIYTFHGQELEEAGEYTAVLEAENGCDSTVTLTLTVLPQVSSAVEASVCAGEIYEFHGQELEEAGEYTAVLEAENGCDSTVTLTLTVLPQASSAVEASVCAGEIYEFHGQELGEAGEYIALLEAENGCDSTVTLTLTVLPHASSAVEASVCAGEIYEFHGQELEEAGEYTAVLEAENGCDSIVTLTLTVLPQASSAVEASVCAGKIYEFHGQELEEAGEYTAVLEAENGCDSIVTLTLTVLPHAASAVEATICAGEIYEFHGQELEEAGEYTAVLEAENGCDSTVTLTLTVLPHASSEVEATICAGEIYAFNGQELEAAGEYTAVLEAENGCDSIVTLQLKVLPVSSSGISVTLCEGSTYVFNGDELTTSGTYAATVSGSNGCDSTVTLQLAFVSVFETAISASICSGSTYAFGDQSLAEAGTYTRTLTAAGGCDSIITLTLSLLPLSESSTEASICAGASYSFNGLTLTESGSYPVTLTASNGCDSTAVVHLTVLPVTTTNLAATICASETYAFNGEELAASGIYNATLDGSNGCDSLVVLNLTVLPELSTALAVSVCPGESYVYNGQTLTTAGSYGFTFDGSNGCDSTVIVQLSILPNALGAFAALVCDGASYSYNGEELTESGTYLFTFPGASTNGCDSVVTLFLTIFPDIAPTQTSASICAGSTYDFHGTPLSTAGTYTAHLASTTGCDSTVVLQLSISPVITTDLNASICAGEVYLFNGQELGLPGVYTALLSTAAGCDSIVTLNLQVNSVNTAVSLQDGTLSAEAENATYQWFNCTGSVIIPGANGSTFTPEETGEYGVAIVQGNCLGLSDCILVEVVSTHELLSETAWLIQPNPAGTNATVVLKEALSGQVRLEIYDVAGQLLRRQQVADHAGRVEMDLSGLADGVLLVRLTNGRGSSVKRLVKAEN